MSKKRMFPFLMVGLMAFILIFATACSDKAATSETVATVEGENISKDDLYDFLVKSGGQEALSALIDEKVIALEVKKEKIKIADEDIEKELAVSIENAGGEEAYKAALEQNGLTEQDLKDNIIQYLSIRKLVEPRIEITDDEIETYFKENQELYDQEEQVEASHILVEDEATAKEVEKKIADGEEFAELAKEYSSDGSAENGGELGFFPRGQMVEEFDKAVFEMEVGKISEPIKTEFGYHIIHLTDKNEEKEATLEDHKEEIKEQLFETKLQTEYGGWLTEVKENYKIENKLADTEEKEEK